MKLTVELTQEGTIYDEQKMPGAKHSLIGNTLEIYRKPGDGEQIPWAFTSVKMSDDEMVDLYESLAWSLYSRGLVEKPE